LVAALVLGWVAFVSLARPAGAQVADPRKGLTAEQISELDQCEILVTGRSEPGTGLPEFTMLAVIDTPPAKLWSVVERCADYKGMFPRVSESLELKRAPGRVVCKVALDMPFPLSDLWHTTECLHTSGPPQHYSRAWKLIEGTFEHNRGSWVIGPWGPDGSRSMLRYTAVVKPNMAVPGPIRRHFQRRSLPKIVKALRKKVGQSGCAGPPAGSGGAP